MIVLDSNILIRYSNPKDAAHAVSFAAVTRLQAEGRVLCIVPQNLYEFWATATRPISANGLGLSVVHAQSEIAKFKRFFRLLPDTPNLLDEWETVVFFHACHGRVSYDARIVAAMNTHGITEILTFNIPDFRRFSGVTILDPNSFAVP